MWFDRVSMDLVTTFEELSSGVSYANGAQNQTFDLWVNI